MTDAAKALRAKLCIDSECVHDAGCGCLDAIRAALAAAPAGATDEIERLKAEIERMLKALCEAGEEILRQRKAGAEWQEKYKKLATVGAGVSLSSNEGLENWQQGFAAGIEAAAGLVDGHGLIGSHLVRDSVAADIRALRPAGRADDDYQSPSRPTQTIKTTLNHLGRAQPMPLSASEPAGALKKGETYYVTQGDDVTYDPMGAVMTSEYPVPQAAEPDVARMAEAIQKSIERGCDITPPESMVAARAAYMALRAKEPAGPSEEDVARAILRTHYDDDAEFEEAWADIEVVRHNALIEARAVMALLRQPPKE